MEGEGVGNVFAPDFVDLELVGAWLEDAGFVGAEVDVAGAGGGDEEGVGGVSLPVLAAPKA